jgi:hypothetical protein
VTDQEFYKELSMTTSKVRLPNTKKADGAGLDPLDQAYVQLRDALDADDQPAVQQALSQLTTLASQDAGQASKTKAAQMDPFEYLVKHGNWDGRI